MFLGIACAALYVFIVERICRLQLTFAEGLLWFGIPYAVPILGIIVWNRINKVPLLWNRK